MAGPTWMPAGGSSIFTDADGYQACLRDLFDLLVPHPRDFRARLTWVDLPSLRLLRADEASSRVAYVTLSPEQVFLTFPIKQGSVLIAGGVDLHFGDFMFHSRGERLHQRTTTACRWGSISLPASVLAAAGRTIAGRDLLAPPFGRVVRPVASDRQRLLRLHAQAGRIAETSLDRIGSKEVVRALEQELILALATCLGAARMLEDRDTRRREVRTAVQLEAVLAAHHDRMLRVREIRDATGVSDRTLRASCLRQLGMTASRYQRLRRLKLVRTELLQADPAKADSAAIIRHHGFRELHRFVMEYWDVYGEMPPLHARDPVAR